MIGLRPLAVALLAASLVLAGSPAHGSEQNEPNAPTDPNIARAVIPTGQSFAVPRPSTARPSSGTAGDASRGGWWFGPVGITAALAAVGGLSWAAQRFNLNLGLGLGNGSTRPATRLGVVGSVRLGSKQAMHLVRVGDRVLIIGTGPGSAPQALGEVTDPAELARLAPNRTNPTASTSRPNDDSVVVARSGHPRARLDQRIGDDE